MSEPRTIWFRWFQSLICPVADERRSLALVCVDGERVRFAWNPAPPSPSADYRQCLRVLRDRAAGIEPTREGLLSLGPEGFDRGGSYWSPARCGGAAAPDATFRWMAAEARLVVPGPMPRWREVLLAYDRAGCPDGWRKAPTPERLRAELGRLAWIQVNR